MCYWCADDVTMRWISLRMIHLINFAADSARSSSLSNLITLFDCFVWENVNVCIIWIIGSTLWQIIKMFLAKLILFVLLVKGRKYKFQWTTSFRFSEKKKANCGDKRERESKRILVVVDRCSKYCSKQLKLPKLLDYIEKNDYKLVTKAFTNI